MKKTLSLLLLAALFLPSFAQDGPKESPEKNVMKVNILPLIIGTGSVFYERELNNHLSAQLGLGYMNYKVEKTKLTGLFITPELRFYPKGNAIDGFYMAPYGSYRHWGLANGDNEANYDNYGGGLAFGRQWIFDSGFIIDLFFGGHYASGKVSVTRGVDDFDLTKFEGFRMRVGFNLGFAF